MFQCFISAWLLRIVRPEAIKVGNVKIGAKYPTVEHERASNAIVNFFSKVPDVEAVILTGSCARGKATKDSCLDIMVLLPRKASVSKRSKLERRWSDFYENSAVFSNLRRVGRYSHVDLDFVDGCLVPKPRGWTSGPDEFELEIGNTLVYSVSLYERGRYFKRLKARWLPYYDEELRQERLATVRQFCLNNIDHIPLYVDRGLYFQAFDRLYNAFQEFLQALFISRRTYPIAYDKWIRIQIEEILGLLELYWQLPRLFEIRQFESQEIAQKARELNRLLDVYVKE
jgi:predicted nucleotidyltransferase